MFAIVETIGDKTGDENMNEQMVTWREFGASFAQDWRRLLVVFLLVFTVTLAFVYALAAPLLDGEPSGYCLIKTETVSVFCLPW